MSCHVALYHIHDVIIRVAGMGSLTLQCPPTWDPARRVLSGQDEDEEIKYQVVHG